MTNPMSETFLEYVLRRSRRPCGFKAMTTHVLKIREPYWNDIEAGEKTFEVRRYDRGFQKGDRLVLLRTVELASGEWVVELNSSGAPLAGLDRDISYVLTGGQWGIESGWVVLGLKIPSSGSDR